MQTWVTSEEMLDHLNLTSDSGSLVSEYIQAAETWVSQQVTPPFSDPADPETEPPPAPQLQAVRMLVAHWYENRESTIVGFGSASALPIPFGVTDLLRPYRNWGYTPEEDA